jgi:NAD-dependent dihydropyrimidine dehydrogenase PreA subunit
MYIVTIDTDKCSACAECVDICADGLIAIVEEDSKKFAMYTGDPDDCLACYSCQEMCEEDAVDITEY